MEVVKLPKNQHLEVDYTIQSHGEKSEENLWNTVETFLWSTTDIDEAIELLQDGQHIIYMVSMVDKWDDLGDCISAGYVEVEE